MRKHNIEVRNILVLYTGGTIGMTKNQDGVYSPSPKTFVKKVKSNPEMHDDFLAKKIFNGGVPENVLVFSYVSSSAITYKIIEYNPLLDSSNMSGEHWQRIAEDIRTNYSKYHGFVILHGTDTLCYTASALSFLLEDLDKPVIVTGSQIPIFEQRSDAKDNFLSSLIYAASYRISEVCVFFANHLMRGNRTIKFSSNMLNAFISPNYPVLGKVGIDYALVSENLRNPEETHQLVIKSKLDSKIGILTIFPFVTPQIISGFFNQDLNGAVLMTYGIGNIPSNQEIVEVLQTAVRKGIIIINVTQCVQGTVSVTYETGKVWENIGILPGYDMTAEAAFTKLSYVLGLSDISLEQKKQMMISNLRGELTSP